jgi:hypothetical protein
MDSFADALHRLQGGDLGRPEFFAQLDRVLANTSDSGSRLLEVLSDEHARKPLPGEVYIEVQQRIQRLIAARQRMGGDDTFVQTKPGAYPIPEPSPSLPRGDVGRADPEPERIKGTGDTLNGRFVLEECIGFGGMGTVYKALDLRKLEASDRKPYIAIKVLNVQFRGHPKSLIALQREARKAQALAHPNIVSVYDFDREGPMVYLTMEYLKGKPLSQVLRAPGFTGMPYAVVQPIVMGMGNALAYAHERGFVHCDFKPGNVFLTDSGNVKVIDFGIARVFHKTEEDVDATVFDPGSLGALTPAYASPEMLEQREPDPRDDIFALGCITYEMLTGRHPFNRVSALQARGAGMKPQRPVTLGRGPWRALRCALSLERDDRTPSVARFLKEFGTPASASRQGMLAASIAGVVALGVLGAAGWYLMARQPQAPAPASASESASAAAGPTATEAAPAVVPPASAPVAPAADAVAAALARIPCSALVGTLRGDMVAVQGFVSKGVGPGGVKDALSGVPGVASVSLDVEQVDAGKCPVIATFAPYWTAYRRAGGSVALHLSGVAPSAAPVLREGASLMVDVTTPPAESFISVDYYSLEESVTHLLPNPRARENRAPPTTTATVGSLGEWGIGRPFGTELVVLVTTPTPLFDTLRPVSEPTADYLADVAKRLEAIRNRSGAGKIAVEFLQIETKAQARRRQSSPPPTSDSEPP